MITELVVTDITKMGTDAICVAGVNYEGKSIRPRLSGGRYILRSWLHRDGQIIQPFTRIGLNLIENQPSPPHTEDWIMQENCLEIIESVEEDLRRAYLNLILDASIQDIFGATIIEDGHARYVMAGQGNRSLGTIRVNAINDFQFFENDGQHDCRLTFWDSTNTKYRLKIVDCTFLDFADSIYSRTQRPGTVRDTIFPKLSARNVYLRVGLARNWGAYPNRCYLQINGVYTFPNYMG